MSELAKRVAVAAVGIPAVLWLVWVGGWALGGVLAVLTALGTLELYRMVEATGARPFVVLGCLGSASLVLMATAAPWPAGWALHGLPLIGGLLLLCAVSAIFLRAPQERPLEAIGFTLLGVLYVGLPLSVVPLLVGLPASAGWAPADAQGWPSLVVIALPLAATWVGDSAAYFAGSAWGDKKLAPRVSPKKSWVGFWAELVGAAAAVVAWLAIVGPRMESMPLSWGLAGALGVLLGVGAVAGDLVESLFKRQAGVKDSGAIFPGHGGVLDRIDALLVNLPLAYASLLVLAAAG